jgi:SAM-dependent methyltransferase
VLTSTRTGPAVSEEADVAAGRVPRHAAGAELARYYDLDLQEDHEDVEMYVALAAASDGPILELACGTGRICVPLAAAGHEVVGVDNDRAMLARAQRRWETRHKSGNAGALRLVEADMRELALGERFGLVVLGLNSLLLLPDRAAQQGVLEIIAAHLSPSGRAVIDVWLPTPDDLALYDGRLVLDWVRRDEEFDESVAKMTAARYAPASAVAVITSIFDAWRDSETPRRTHRVDEIRFVGWSELRSMLDRAGLAVQIAATDYALNELEDDSDRLVIVCTSKRRRGRGPSVGRSDRRGLL